jgi:hypothetical protein
VCGAAAALGRICLQNGNRHGRMSLVDVASRMQFLTGQDALL